MLDPFPELPRRHFGAILCDVPWHFQSWTNGRWKGDGKVFTPPKTPEYHTMSVEQIAALPVADLAVPDCALFFWGIWSMLSQALDVIKAWAFTYKTCAFCWVKTGPMGLGYWVRQNSEFCLLATKVRPKRKSAAVRQGIIEPRREHSRKPDCVRERIEKLVDGPYLELFSRQSRAGWVTWGNEATKFSEARRGRDENDFGDLFDFFAEVAE